MHGSAAALGNRRRDKFNVADHRGCLRLRSARQLAALGRVARPGLIEAIAGALPLTTLLISLPAGLPHRAPVILDGSKTAYVVDGCPYSKFWMLRMVAPGALIR